MNKEKWQVELNELKLSTEQKQKMIQHVHEGKLKKQVHWGYRITLPSFIAFALLFIILTLQPNLGVMPSTTGADQTTEMDHTSMANELLYWGLVASILLLASIAQAFVVLFKTTRWDELSRVQHIREFFRLQLTYRYLHIATIVISVLTFGFLFGFQMFAFVNSLGIVGWFVGIFVSSCILTVSFAWVSRQFLKKIYGHFRFAAWVKIQATLIAVIYSVMWLVTFLLIVSNPLLLLELYMAVLLTVNVCLLMLFSLRKHEHPHCPTCGANLTTKEIWKKTWAPYKEKCNHCGGELHVTTQARNSLGKYSMLSFILLFLPSFGVSFWAIIICLVLYLSFIIFWISPLITKFSDKEQLLW